MLFYILSWLIASFLQGLFFFCIMCCLLYWFYIKELPVNKLSPNKPQFENYEFNQVFIFLFVNLIFYNNFEKI